MRYVLYALLVFVVLLAVVLILGAVRLKRKSAPAHDAFHVEIDEAAALDHFCRAVRLKTVWPRQGEIDYSQFDAFLPLLRELYPVLFGVLEVNIVNRYGLLLKWKGQSAEKPVVLMAHYDVVAADASKWSCDPFCGEIRGGKVWGRGSLDTKCIITALLEAGEGLVKQGYTPQNDVWFSFGNNEETGGDTVPAIVDWLDAHGVKPWFVLDEGGAVVSSPALGVKGDFAMIGVSEKGVCDTILTMNGMPGHSSTPKDSDATTRLIKAVSDIQAHPFPAKLSDAVKEMLCKIAGYASFPMRLVFGNLWLFKPLVLKIMKGNAETGAMIRSTVALTKLEGSDTINVIPNKAVAGFSVRVAPWDSPDDLMAKIKARAGEHAEVSSEYTVYPSPVSPTGSDAFRLLERTVDAVYPGVPAVPYVMTGGTDSKHFTRICENVYRFGAFRFTTEERAAMHGNDETLSVKSYLDGIQFYYKLLQSI